MENVMNAMNWNLTVSALMQKVSRALLSPGT